jgi:hypothetical protein
MPPSGIASVAPPERQCGRRPGREVGDKVHHAGNPTAFELVAPLVARVLQAQGE